MIEENFNFSLCLSPHRDSKVFVPSGTQSQFPMLKEKSTFFMRGNERRELPVCLLRKGIM